MARYLIPLLPQLNWRHEQPGASPVCPTSRGGDNGGKAFNCSDSLQSLNVSLHHCVCHAQNTALLTWGQIKALTSGAKHLPHILCLYL